MITRLATAKPTFRRSSERKVTDPNERLTIEADRREQRRLATFEAIGRPAAAAPAPVERLDLSDNCERLLDAMCAEDVSSFDVEGRVYP